jgi:hypothetical protein
MSDAFETCDLCKKNEAASLFTLLSGKRKGEPVAVCWKCPLGVPDELLDEFVYAVYGGTSVRLAAMFVTGRTPAINTDDVFMRGWKKSGPEQFAHMPRLAREAYLEPAKRAGVSTNGKVYFSELASFPGDPRAWIGTKGEAQALLRERRWSCDALGVNHEPVERPDDVPLAADIVDRHVEEELAEVPEPDRTERVVNDTRAKVIDRHAKKRQISTGSPSKGRRRFRDFLPR